MNARRGLAVLALTALLSVSLTACGGSDDDVTYKAAPSNTSTPDASPDQEATEAVPTDFADDEAQSALSELCDALDASDVAELLGVPETKVEYAVSEAQDSLSKDHAYCMFDVPEAEDGSVDGLDGQTFLSVSVKGPSSTPTTGGQGGVVKFADGSTGYYSDTTLLVTPTGSAYEFTFNVVLPYEVSGGGGGIDAPTADLLRTKAAEAAGGALN